MSIYVSSKSKHANLWRELAKAVEISSSWIHQAFPLTRATPEDYSEMWRTRTEEIVLSSAFVLLYDWDVSTTASLGHNFVEVGIALVAGIPVFIAAPGKDQSILSLDLTSWMFHPSVRLLSTANNALDECVKQAVAESLHANTDETANLVKVATYRGDDLSRYTLEFEDGFASLPVGTALYAKVDPSEKEEDPYMSLLTATSSEELAAFEEDMYKDQPVSFTLNGEKHTLTPGVENYREISAACLAEMAKVGLDQLRIYVYFPHDSTGRTINAAESVLIENGTRILVDSEHTVRAFPGFCISHDNS
jgi:hypothetical protein